MPHSDFIAFAEASQHDRDRKARKYGYPTWEAMYNHLDEDLLDPEHANDPQYRACMLAEHRNFLTQTFEWL